jgi:hypothetical protein
MTLPPPTLKQAAGRPRSGFERLSDGRDREVVIFPETVVIFPWAARERP